MTITIDFLSLGIGAGIGFAAFGLFFTYVATKGF